MKLLYNLKPPSCTLHPENPFTRTCHPELVSGSLAEKRILKQVQDDGIEWAQDDIWLSAKRNKLEGDLS